MLWPKLKLVPPIGRGGGSSFGGLDLSQVTDGYDKLSINYEPEDEMTEDEMRQADALGFQPWSEQYLSLQPTRRSRNFMSIKVFTIAGRCRKSTTIGYANGNRTQY
jgi:hypothetical protein